MPIAEALGFPNVPITGSHDNFTAHEINPRKPSSLGMAEKSLKGSTVNGVSIRVMEFHCSAESKKKRHKLGMEGF